MRFFNRVQCKGTAKNGFRLYCTCTVLVQKISNCSVSVLYLNRNFSAVLYLYCTFSKIFKCTVPVLYFFPNFPTVLYLYCSTVQVQLVQYSWYRYSANNDPEIGLLWGKTRVDRLLVCSNIEMTPWGTTYEPGRLLIL